MSLKPRSADLTGAMQRVMNARDAFNGATQDASNLGIELTISTYRTTVTVSASYPIKQDSLGEWNL